MFILNKDMAKFVKAGSRQNIISALWDTFVSQDRFTKIYIVFALLIVAVTPFIVSNRLTLIQGASTCSPANCSGNYTGPSCNGTTCMYQGNYCSGGVCVHGWAGGVAASNCSPVCGAKPNVTTSPTRAVATPTSGNRATPTPNKNATPTPKNVYPTSINRRLATPTPVRNVSPTPVRRIF